MLFHYGPVTLTTDGSGDEEQYLGSRIRGRVLAIKYDPGTIDTGATLTVTGETSAVPILIKTNAGTAVTWFYPQAAPCTVATGAAITDGQADVWLYQDRIKVTIASGGDTLTGTIEAWVEEER